MINGDHYYILNLDIPIKRRRKENDEFHVYCDKGGPKIDVQEKKFWKKKIKKYLKPLEQDKNKEKAATEALIELRNSVCLFVFLLNAILVTIMYSLTEINAFKDTLSVKFTCDGNDVRVVPIAIFFAAVFGLLLFIQFICMLYHRISTLIHITAETKIREDAHDRSMNRTLGVAEFLTNPLTSKSTKHELISDKKRNDLEMNRSVKMPEKEAKITSIDDIVDKQMVHLKAMKGKLDEKQQDIIRHWKMKLSKHATIATVAWQALDDHKNQPKPNRGKTNKVEPQPSTSSDVISGPPPNCHLQNQEPISGTDNNV
jgi:chitin synthase